MYYNYNYGNSTQNNYYPESGYSNQNYYNNQNQISDNTTPVTLTWNVNAYAKIKTNIFKKIKNKIRPPSPPPEKQPNYFNYYEPQQVEDPKYKHLIKNVSGIAKPGQLLAIMGASGSGKTTLLNVLNFRNRANLLIDGDVKINGQLADWEKLTRYSGYVLQDDLFNPLLTVRETLTFAAMLKMGDGYSTDEKYQRVEQVLNDLSLVKSQNTRVGQGDTMKGISGGEKRRLAFATEILTNPPLLFCDEPTSGLDSFMAMTVVETMEMLANSGKTVISTIHQPSSQIFEKFNSLCLLAEGRTAYFGPARDAKPYFARLGYQVPNLYNPADFYINTLAITPNAREESLQKVNRISDAFAQSSEKSRIDSAIYETESYGMGLQENNVKKYTSNFFSQLYWLFWRQFKVDFRSPLATRILGVQALIISVFIGLIFLRLANNEKGVQNRLGVLYILLMQCNFGYVISVVNSLPADLPLIFREIKSRVYGITPFYIVKQIVELPKYIIFPFTLVTIAYWMSGILDNAEVYFQICFTLVFCAQVAVSFGVFVSVISPSLDVALSIVIPILMPLLIFGGFFLSNRAVPDYFIWIKYLSWFYYTNEIQNSLLWPKVGAISCTVNNAGIACPTTTCFKNGDDVLTLFSFDKNNLARNYGVLAALLVFFRLVSYIVLKIKARPTK